MYIDPRKQTYGDCFIYSKDGVEEVFNEENTHGNDSTWTFVDMENRLVHEGEKPAIEDFALGSIYFDEIDESWNLGGDITDLVLSTLVTLFDGFVFS